MTDDQHTPDNHMLARFGAGLLEGEEAQACEQYLRDSEQAASRLGQLDCDDTLLQSLRDTDVDEDLEESVVDELVDRISGRLMADQLQGSADELINILAPAESADELGRLGNYRLLSVIGVGGMGVVFAAEDLELQREVALKAMKPVLAASESAAQRFQREARAAAAFQHDRIVTIYQVGQAQGVPFFTMQRLEGESLGSRLQNRTKLNSDKVIDLATQICEGLVAAHERGLLHRDIKPDNIWLQSRDDSVKILDFGLVRSADNETNLTNSGAILGTPKYMSPEQARGSEVDPRSDLFSLGSVLYHAVTGENPFSGGNVVSTLMAVANEAIKPPHEIEPQTSRALSDLIMRLLEKEPQDRPASASQVLDELRDIKAGNVRPRTAARRTRPWTNGIWWATAAISALLMAAIILVQTNRGTLVIEAAEGVSVDIEKEGVWLRDTKSGKKLHVGVGKNRLKSGRYEIVVSDADSGWNFSAESFTLRRGDERRVAVTLKAGTSDANAKTADATEDKPPVSPLEIPVDDKLINIAANQPLFDRALVRSPQALQGIRTWTWVRRGGEYGSSAIAPHPKRKWIATGNALGEVRVLTFDSNTRDSIVHVLPGVSIAVRNLSWSPNGNLLAVAHHSASRRTTESVVRIWRVEEEQARLVRELQVDARRIAWSPDGGRLAFGGKTVQLMDATSSVAAMLPNSGIDGQLSRQPWSPDAKQIVTHVVGEGLKVWDVDRRRVFHSFNITNAWGGKWHREGRYLAFFSGKMLTEATPSSRNRTSELDVDIQIWDMRTLRSVKTLPLARAFEIFGRDASDVFSDPTFAHFSWSPDGARIATILDGKVEVWDVVTGARATVGKFETQGDPQNYRSRWKAPHWSASGDSLFAISRTGDVARWNVGDKKQTWVAESRDVNYLFAAQARPGRLVLARFNSGHTEYEIAVWDIARRRYVLRVPQKVSTGGTQHMPFSEFSLSHDGRQLVALRSDVIAPKPGEDPGTSRRPRGFPGAATQTHYTVKFFDGSSDKPTRIVEFDASAELAPYWSPDGTQVALMGNVASRGGIATKTFLLDPKSGLVRTVESDFTRPKNTPISLYSQFTGRPTANPFHAWLSDGKRLIPWHDKSRVAIQHLETGDVMAITPEIMAKQIKAASAAQRQPRGGPSRQRSGRSGRPIRPVISYKVGGAVASSDGKRVAIIVATSERNELGRDNVKALNVEVWSIDTKEPKHVVTIDLAPFNYVSKLRFSADGKQLVMIGSDETAKLTAMRRDIATGELVEKPIQLSNGGDSRGLASAMMGDKYLINSGMSVIRVLDQRGTHQGTLLVAPTRASTPILTLGIDGSFENDATENSMGEVLDENMIFVGLTEEGSIVTRRAKEAIKEYGFRNQPVEAAKLLPPR